jgi:histone chaperone ASF1
LSWKIIYVGSALSEDFDQTLEEFDIGPIENKSTLKFDISCSSPDPSKIPRRELLCTPLLILGVTALILTASYRAQEFIRVGYYVHNQLQE